VDGNVLTFLGMRPALDRVGVGLPLFLWVTTGFGRSRAFPGNLFVDPGIFVGPGLCASAFSAARSFRLLLFFF
jgi:hypothetical protein